MIKAVNEENNKEEKVLSPWYIIDKLLLIASLMISSSLSLTHYAGIFMPLFWISVILLILNIANKKKYYISPEKGEGRKSKTVILRTLVYAVIIGLILMPFNMRRQWKWFYPLQRSFYVSGFAKGNAIGRLLPKTIPSDAEKYYVNFRPAILQASGSVDIKYYTDRETVEEYIEKAEKECIGKYDFSQYYFDDYTQMWTADDENTDAREINRFAQIIEADEENPENCVVYVYGNYTYNTALAIFNTDTGYVRFYY